MTDKKLVKRRFAANFGQYNLLAHTQQAICGELAQMMRDLPPPRSALEVGTGTGFLTRLLTAAWPETHWTLNDLTEASQEYLEPYTESLPHTYLWGDAETLDFPSGLELVASASTVQWFDDLQAFVEKCAAATLPGGHLGLSTFGPENFAEIAALTGEGLTYPTLAEITAMLAAAGYETLQSREYARRLDFASPLEVLRHIRATGVNSLSGRTWTPRRLADFERRYRASFALPDARIPLTYHPILLVARRR